MSADKNITLSIEATIGSGSISLLKNGEEIDSWSGDGRQSTNSENILERILNSLKNNTVRAPNLERICVSKETGSLTGEKIGLAISRGLGRAFNCPVVEVSLLNAILLNAGKDFRGQILVAASTGKNRVLWQVKEVNRSAVQDVTPVPGISSDPEFIKIANAEKYDMVLLAQRPGMQFYIDELPKHLPIVTEQLSKVSFLLAKAAAICV